MKTRFLHAPTGMTGTMHFEPRGLEACIAIEHLGERKETIIDHPVTVETARKACAERDIETYIGIWRMGMGETAEARAA